MNRKLLKILHKMNALIFIGLFGWIGQATAGDPMYFCIGEKHTNCSIQPVYDCGTSADAIAQGLCIVTSGGQKKPLPYILTSLGGHDGNRCGYAKYRVECVTDLNLKDLDLKNSAAALSNFKKMEEMEGMQSVK